MQGGGFKKRLVLLLYLILSELSKVLNFLKKKKVNLLSFPSFSFPYFLSSFSVQLHFNVTLKKMKEWDKLPCHLWLQGPACVRLAVCHYSIWELHIFHLEFSGIPLLHRWKTARLSEPILLVKIISIKCQ